MKFLVVVLALCVAGAFAGITEEQKNKLNEHRQACTEETKVDPTVVDNAKNGNIAEDDEKLKCFFACMLKKISVMNADGTFNEEMFRSKLPATIEKSKVDDVVKKCKDMTGANECETGAKLFECYMKEKTFVIFD